MGVTLSAAPPTRETFAQPPTGVTVNVGGSPRDVERSAAASSTAVPCEPRGRLLRRPRCRLGWRRRSCRGGWQLPYRYPEWPPLPCNMRRTNKKKSVLPQAVDDEVLGRVHS